MTVGRQQAAALRRRLAAGVLAATIGGRNFEVYRNYDRPPASRASPDTQRELRRAVPQQTCIVDTEGRTRCK